MICERCGNDMMENTTICPVCGALTAKARARLEPATSYGPYPTEIAGEPASYEQGYERGYSAQATPPLPTLDYPFTPPRPQQPPYGQFPHRPQPQQHNYAPPSYNYPPRYTPYPAQVNFTVVTTGKNEGALITEIVCSLFGIFGIGWLMGGETAIGTVLLIGSFLLYWPLMLGITIMTFGLGLLCMGPLAIGVIILNALLLNSKLKRKANQYYMMPPPPHMHMPPQR